MHSNSDSQNRKIKLSTVPLKILMALLVLGPWYGVFTSYINSEALIGLIASKELFINFSIYTLILILAIASIKSNIDVPIKQISQKKLSIISQRLVTLSIICFISIFLFSGIHTLTGNLDRGEVRVNAGILGPLYAFSLKYLLPLLSLLTSIILYNNGKIKVAFFIYITIIISGFITGGKATTIFILLSTACYFWPKISIMGKISISIISLAIIITSHIFFNDQEVKIEDSINYNIARSTTVAAYGVLGSWDYHQTSKIEIVPSIINSIFGAKITNSFLLFIGETSSPIYWDIGKLITYNYYPAWERAQEGTVNLTLTVFSDFILYFGDYWIFGLLFFNVLFFLFILKMVKLLSNGEIILGSLMFIYLNMTILPVVNSGGVFQLFSLPVLVYYLLLYAIMKIYIWK